MKTILVVDDSAVIQRTIKYTLRREGFRVLTANDGLDALGQIQDNAVDLVVADIDMPHLDGFGLLRHLRGQAQTVNLPVIMLTGSGSGKDWDQAKSAGANGMLTKPAGSSELLSLVQKWLASPVAN